jgi:hypothetical protein
LHAGFQYSLGFDFLIPKTVFDFMLNKAEQYLAENQKLMVLDIET